MPALFSINRYPALRFIDPACQWLTMRQQFGLAPNTLDAYARALDSYITFLNGRCDICTGSGTADVSAWINHCHVRGLANATMIQRVTALRLFFEYLVEEGIRSKNPVSRGGAIRNYGSLVFRQAGPVRRINRLPWIPTDAEWERLLGATQEDSLRDRAMLALAYDAALRREELCSVEVTDFDFARKILIVRAEMTKNRSGKVVPYSSATSILLCRYLHRRHTLRYDPGPFFLSESPRNRAKAIGPYTWTKVVKDMAERSGLPKLTTHTIRHLRLTDLARAGLDLHEIATLAGHRVLRSTMIYIHLGARDLTKALSRAMAGMPLPRYPQLRPEEV